MYTQRPWIGSYDKGVPGSLLYPDHCVHDYLVKQAQKIPDRVAIVAGKNTIHYRNLYQQVSRFSSHLMMSGLRAGDRVGICLPNSPGFVIACFGVLQAGGVVAAMNPLFPIRELEFQSNTADVKLVITDSRKIKDFRTMEIQRKPVVLLMTESGQWNELTDEESPHFGLATDPGLLHVFPVIESISPAVLQFSGGTTGTPKAAIGTHKNLVANVTQFRSWLINLEDGKETFLIAIPLFHVYGLVLGLLLGVAMGATMVLLENPGNVEELLSAINKYPISYFPAVPSILNLINNHPGVIGGQYDMHHIKACISGSAPLLTSVRERFENLTGGSLVEGYGLSEAPTATHCNPVGGEKRTGSIGLPLPDVDCRIVSIENGQVEREVGGEGELLIRGPQVMSGYFNNPIESAAALADGWLHTGDIARMDEEGYFYISGRIKDLIKVHGMQVWPTEVEVVLSQHPSVKECAVAGVPDDKAGERVKAWVILQADKQLTIEELRDFCRNRIAAYKIPSELSIRSSLPKTPVGKVLRRELVKEHLEEE